MRSVPVRFHWLLLVIAAAPAASAFAQTSAKPGDFTAPALSGIEFSSPGQSQGGKAKAARPAPVTRSRSAPAAQPALDPYEKARKAQTDYFRRQADEQEVARQREKNDPKFFKDAPRSPVGVTGQGLQMPLSKF